MSTKRSSAVLGTQQSPINIIHSESLYVPSLEKQFSLDYSNGTASGHFQDDNFVLADSEKWSCTYRGVPYRLAKIHLHNSCEHELDGVEPGMFELHLLHTLAGSEDKLVLAVWVDPVKSEQKKAFAQWNEAFRQGKGKSAIETSPTVSVELSEFVPQGQIDFWTYFGSLTSHPYSQDVLWVVSKAHIPLDPDLVTDLTGAQQEARCVQPLYRRFVLRCFK